MQDARTANQQSLETKDRSEALCILEIKRQAAISSAFNQVILNTRLSPQDPQLAKRTWQTVMDQIQTHGKESNKCRCVRSMKTKACSFKPERCDRNAELRFVPSAGIAFNGS